MNHQHRARTQRESAPVWRAFRRRSWVLAAVCLAWRPSGIVRSGAAAAAAAQAELVASLASPDANVRAEAFRQAEALGPGVIELAATLLESADVQLELTGHRLLSGAAVRATRSDTPASHRAELKALLHRLVKPGHAPAARDSALHALELVGEADSVEHVAPLLEAFPLRDRALRALQRIDTAEARQAVVQAVGSAESSFRPALLLALGQMTGPEGEETLLAWAGQETEPAARAAALRALGCRGAPRAISLLMASWAAAPAGAARDEMTESLLALVQGVARREVTWEEREAAATAAERIIGEASEPAHVCAALRALALVGTDRDAIRVVLPLAAGEPGAVRDAARAALASWSAEIDQLVGDVMAGRVGRPVEQRAAALFALIDRMPPVASWQIEHAIDTGDAGLQRAALQMAAVREIDVDWPVLESAVGAERPEPVRAAALAAFGGQALRAAAGGAADPAIGERLLWLAARAEVDAQLRVDAAWAAGRVLGIERAAELERLLSDPTVHPGAARGIIAMAAAAPDPESGVPLLERLLDQTADPAILREIGVRLGERSNAAWLHAERDGFLVHWWVAAPFPNPGGSAFERVYPPEELLDLKARYEVEGRAIEWRPVRVSDPLGRIDLVRITDSTPDVAAYAYTDFTVGTSTNVLLCVGSDEGVVVWLNGEGVHGVNAARGLKVDEDIVPITLRAGPNSVLVKSLQGRGEWSFCARIADPQRRPLSLEALAALAPPPVIAPAAAEAFAAARPIWLAGRAAEMNLQAGFRAVLDLPQGGALELRATGSSVYRATVNGEFAGYGPARGPHGWFRIDAWDLTPYLVPGRNVIALEVAGYNVNSYYLLDQPAFLQAELVGAGGRVVAATGGGRGIQTFDAIDLTGQRVQRVARYSFQRAFTEVYRFDPAWDAWRADPDFVPQGGWAAAEPQPAPMGLLPRRVALPDVRRHGATAALAGGRVEMGPPPAAPWKDRSMVNIGPQFKGYPESELELAPSIEIQGFTFVPEPAEGEPPPPAGAGPWELDEGAYRVFDLGTNLTGFVSLDVACAAPARVFVTFDELPGESTVDFKRLGCINLISYELAPGSYRLESFEPYTLRYAAVIAVAGSCRVNGFGLRDYACSGVDAATFEAEDERLERLFIAGRETFRQNALDVFMDCPSRERAGWLCDSFFTARVAPDLTGTTAIERTFIENFLLPDAFAHLPEGMLPMCYPADHPDGVFIPNWAMWFVIQLEEYLERTGDRDTIARLEPRVRRLIALFDSYMNEQGLLEHLPSWVFVEWSRANDFTQDVNFPSNMLYAGVLDAAGRLYGDSGLAARAAALRERIRAMAFDGDFFVDNAVRRDTNDLVPTRNRTEVCQYFAFFFGVATPEEHPELWRRLVDEFGPRRAEKGLYSDVHPANAFIGNMLRVELLSRAGRPQQILDESIDYLLYMAERTGTLWEHTTPNASCNHGFASHIVHTLYRDILGVRVLSRPERRVEIVVADLRMAWCAGSIPVPEGTVSVRWSRRDDGSIGYRVEAPEGYAVTVTPGRAGLTIVPEQ